MIETGQDKNPYNNFWISSRNSSCGFHHQEILFCVDRSAAPRGLKWSFRIQRFSRCAWRCWSFRSVRFLQSQGCSEDRGILEWLVRCHRDGSSEICLSVLGFYLPQGKLIFSSGGRVRLYRIPSSAYCTTSQ